MAKPHASLWRALNAPGRLVLIAGPCVIESERLCLRVAAALHELPFKQGVQRVMTHIAIDDRRDKEVFLGDKKKSVQARLK